MELTDIEIEKVRPNPMQPRETFSKKEFRRLAESIEEQGLLQPIIVRRGDDNYEIIAGERRWRAFSHLDRNAIPAIVWDDIDDIEMAEKSIIENWQREELTNAEKENMIFQIQRMGGYSHRELGKKLGISHTQVGRYLRAKKDREELEPTGSIATRDLDRTRSLDDESRKWVLSKMSKGKISKRAPEKTVKVIKDAPPKIRKAITEDKVDIDDVEGIADLDIPEDKEDSIVEEFTRRKKMRDTSDESQKHFDREYVKGNVKGQRVKPKRSNEEILVDKLQKIRDKLCFLPVVSIKRMKIRKRKERSIEWHKQIF